MDQADYRIAKVQRATGTVYVCQARPKGDDGRWMFLRQRNSEMAAREWFADKYPHLCDAPVEDSFDIGVA